MKKSLKKAFSVILVFALMLSFPMAASASAGDLATLTIKGVTADITGGDTTFGSVTPKTVTLTWAQANTASSAPVATFDTAGTITWAKFDATTTPAAGGVTSAAVDSAGYTDGVLKDGDELWGKTATGTYYQFVISVGTNPGGTIPGDSTVENVVLNVILPTNLNFALNPLELGTNTAGSQLKTADYVVVNKTGAPVEVTFNLTATPNDSTVTLVDKTTDLKKDDTSATDKKIYLAALGASTVTPGTLNFATIPGTAAFTYDATKATKEPLAVVTDAGSDLGKAKGTIAFALGAATDTGSTGSLNTLAATNTGVASFQFFGEMNTYANWQPSDVTISGAYTLTALRASTYAAYGATVYQADSLNQLKPKVATYATTGFIVSGSTVTALSTNVTSAKTATTDLEIPFYFGDKTISSLTWTYNSGAGTYTLPPAQYEISGNNLVLKRSEGTYTLRTTSADLKPAKLTLSDDSTYTFTISVTES